jgi:tetratricopeptide (TPR) repeat protein
MTRLWKFLLSIVVGACLVLAVWIAIHEGRTPQNETEVLNRMIELEKEGRYDKAVQVVQNWMSNSRHNISNDGTLYDQIAFAYIAKAYKKPATRDESVHQAEMNLEKALGFFDKKKRGDIDIDLFEIGGAYEILGDVSDKDKCRFYEIARHAFERQLPLIKGDSYTAYGKTIPLEPVRADIRKHLEGVIKKFSGAGCQAH